RFRLVADTGTNRVQINVSHTRDQDFFTQKGLLWLLDNLYRLSQK
ncbi:MAG: hypothetical protein ACI8ZV_001468, partial [Chitinophagales bacterium]